MKQEGDPGRRPSRAGSDRSSIPRLSPFSPSEYRRRLTTVQAGIRDRDLVGLLLFSPPNIEYLTGMQTENFFKGQSVIVPADGEPTLVIPEVERGRWRASSWVSEPHVYGIFDDFIGAVADAVRAVGATRGTLGVERRTRQVTADQIRRLDDVLPTSVRTVDGSPIIEGARLVKSEEEIAQMERAAELTDAGVRSALRSARAGIEDRELAATIVETMYREGSGPLYWGPIVAAGPWSGVPHATFCGHQLKGGDTVFVELTGQHNRYVAPLMRTISVGEPSPEIRTSADIVAEVLAAVMEEMRPGVPAAHIARRGEELLEPILDRFLFHHYFGYPVGLIAPGTWVEELGFFVRVDNDRPLRPGMTFHIPISIRREGTFGIGLSQTVVVREQGAVALSELPPRVEVVPA